MRSLEPLWKIESKDVLSLMKRADDSEQTGGYVKKCSIAKGKLNGCGTWAGNMSRHLDKELRNIPDMTFVVNFIDEPVVLPLNTTTLPSESEEKFTWTDMAHQPLWQRIQEMCSQNGIPRSESAPVTEGLHFITNATEVTDLCLPPEYSKIHGYLASPVNSRHIYQNIPILSRAAPSPFADILFPAPSYSWSQFAYNAWSDRSWERKEDAVY